MPLGSLLDDLMGSRAKIRILRLLVSQGGGSLGVREIARRTGLSHTGVARAVSELGDAWIIQLDHASERRLFRINKEHHLFATIASLFEQESAFGDVIVALLRKHVIGTIVGIVLFGSVARGEDRADSDVDVLIVLSDEDDRDEVFDLLGALDSWSLLGKHLQSVVYTLSELGRAVERRLPLMDSIMRDGRVLYGPDVDHLFWKASRAADEASTSSRRTPAPRKGAGAGHDGKARARR